MARRVRARRSSRRDQVTAGSFRAGAWRSLQVEKGSHMSVSRERSWWIGIAEDGHPLFVQAAPGADPEVEQAGAGGSGWRAVAPLEFYRSLVEYLADAPEREEAFLEAMEETLEQWERASSN
jgi:hypothetical protein